MCSRFQLETNTLGVKIIYLPSTYVETRLIASARFDHKTHTLTEANLGENRYPSEPIYAPDAQNPDQGWVITVVYDGNSHSSEVW